MCRRVRFVAPADGFDFGSVHICNKNFPPCMVAPFFSRIGCNESFGYPSFVLNFSNYVN